MSLSLAAVTFVPGLALGSFLNVVAARVPLHRSIVRRLRVHELRHELSWHENIPVFSYLALRGRCRGCGTRIGFVYPGRRALTAALIAACFFAFGVTAEAFVASFFCAVLVVVSATDLSHRIIPNVIVLPATGIVLVAQTVLEPSPEWALAAFGGSSCSWPRSRTRAGWASAT